MTIVRTISNLYRDFTPQSRGWLTGDEAEYIRSELKLADADTERLREIRDIIVLTYLAKAPKDRQGDNFDKDMELNDKMSGFTAVVDSELYRRGEAV